MPGGDIAESFTTFARKTIRSICQNDFFDLCFGMFDSAKLNKKMIPQWQKCNKKFFWMRDFCKDFCILRNAQDSVHCQALAIVFLLVIFLRLSALWPEPCHETNRIAEYISVRISTDISKGFLKYFAPRSISLNYSLIFSRSYFIMQYFRANPQYLFSVFAKLPFC